VTPSSLFNSSLLILSLVTFFFNYFLLLLFILYQNPNVETLLPLSLFKELPLFILFHPLLLSLELLLGFTFSTEQGVFSCRFRWSLDWFAWLEFDLCSYEFGLLAIFQV